MNQTLKATMKSFEQFAKALKSPKKLSKKQLTNQSGFSLIEILVALTLLGIAGTFVAGKIFEQLEEGKMKAADIQINTIKGTLKEFRRKCGFYPSTEDGLNALVEAPSSRECRNYPPEGFLEDGFVPLDPWEYDYSYTSDGSTFEIVSGGPDNEIGTDDDISSKRKPKQAKGN